MNNKHIQDLLDKYLEGETSLNEERELKKFFTKTVLIPEEWESYKLMFGYFESEGLKTMSVKEAIQKKKHIFWLVGVGISLAATALILLMVYFPPTKNQLQTLATVTKHLDSTYAPKTLSKKLITIKPVQIASKKRVKINRVPVLKIPEDDSLKLLASGNDDKHKEISIQSIINETLAPLDNMEVFNKAMDNIKYIDVINKYLPDQDFTKLFSNYK